MTRRRIVRFLPETGYEDILPGFLSIKVQVLFPEQLIEYGMKHSTP